MGAFYIIGNNTWSNRWTTIPYRIEDFSDIFPSGIAAINNHLKSFYYDQCDEEAAADAEDAAIIAIIAAC